MSKLVILELDGDLADGLRASLEIGDDGDHPVSFLRLKGRLPAAPDLAQILQTHWSDHYRNLNAPYRIKPKRILLHRSLEACCESARELRDRLNAWLDSPEFRPLDQRLRQELGQAEDIRLLVRTNNLELQKLPWTEWELLRSYPRAEPALAPLEAKVHRLDRHLPCPVKVRILAILGHDEGIDVERDRQCLEDLPAADVRFLVKPSRREVIDQLQSRPWDIIFFAGHSETEGDVGRVYLNPDESLTVDELWYSLRKAVDRGLQLAIFNSCDGLGLAQRLDELAIPQMIVMRELIPDRVAQSFLVSFLQNFAAGLPLYVAVREARQRLHDEWEGELPCASWLPVIFQGAGVPPPAWAELHAHAPMLPVPPSNPALSQRPTSRKPHRRAIALSLILATSFTLGLQRLGWLQGLELSAFDELVRRRPPESQDERFLLVVIGEQDKQYQQQLDMERRESLSPEALDLLWQKLAPHQPRLLGLNILDFRSDAELNTTLKRDRRIIASCQTANPVAELDAVPPPLGFTDDRLGFSSLVTDHDDVVRRQVLGHRDDEVCPSDRALSLRLAERYLEASMDPERQQLQDLFLPRLTNRAGGYALSPASVSSYQILVNYRNADWKIVNLARILSGELDSQLPALVRDRIVLVGGDRYASDATLTPLRSEREAVPSIVVHAQLTSQLISAVQDDRKLLSWWPDWADSLWILAWATLGSLVTLLTRWRSRMLGIMIGFVSSILLGYFLFQQGLWLPLIAPAFAFVVASTIGIVTLNLMIRHVSTTRHSR
ncbi:MAG: CHASE2 domain-containing protein [Spirulinaceae cyanobacterium RM2_2_10]|nr:CHASE2 domain-containing protein [Spirulinaceae cyanobacterium SM2_1_0]NJO19217.1 CHASE2 domain-containing protein [Spirulinaceae cyanobacterium RM2_2_10]